ncbi:MAG: AAA family ATPase [Candidatus Pacearchaeota archaeon]
MKTIAIISGKGGVGKTTSAINLSVFLSQMKQNVLLIDANINTPDVGVSLNAPVVPISLQHVLSGKEKPENAIYVHNSGVKIMPSSLSLYADIKNLERIIKKLTDFDFIILDSAAGLNEDVVATIKAADECIIVTNPELPAMTGALKTIKLVEKLKKPILGILVTRKTKNQISLKDISTLLGYPIIGVVPEDDKVKQALMEKDTLLNFPKSKAAKEYKKLAFKILNIEDKDRNLLEKISDALRNIKITIKFDK